ncbi:MAG: hypothetical protein EB120_04855 [Proteobacteria bacterium]|nr:hypothetical protein [Pseudomonadota bacterium]
MERDEGIYMSKQGQFFYSTVSDFLNNKLCRKDAAELLEVTERSVTRMARRVNVTHCLEKLREEHGINLGYETLRRWCHEKKLVKRAKKRKTKARYKRVRAYFSRSINSRNAIT